MANRGIGETFSSLVHNIDDAGTTNLNISYNDHNFFYVLPLILIKSSKSFDLSLIYHRIGNRPSSNETFPHQMQFSFFKDFCFQDDSIDVTNADGSIDEYIKNNDSQNKYYCLKNNMYITANSSTSKRVLVTPDGSKYFYNYGENFPDSFYSNNPSQMSYTVEIVNHKIMSISVKDPLDMHDYYLAFHYLSDTGYLSTITIAKRYESIIQNYVETITFVYESTNSYDVNRIYWSKGVPQSSNAYYRYISLSFDNESNDLSLIQDMISHTRAQYCFSTRCDWFRIIHCNDPFIEEKKNFLTYSLNQTKIDYFDGTSSTIYYNSSSLPMFSIDGQGLASTYRFDDNRRIVYQSKPICLNKSANLPSILVNNLFSNGTSGWLITGLGSSVSFQFPYSSITGSIGINFNKISQTISVKGLPGEAYTFSAFVAGLSMVHFNNPLKISITLKNSSGIVVANNSVLSTFSSAKRSSELLSVSALSFAAFSSIEVSVEDCNSSNDWIINQAWLLKAYPKISAEYDAKGDLLSAYSKANETKVLYDTKGRPLVIGSAAGTKVNTRFFAASPFVFEISNSDFSCQTFTTYSYDYLPNSVSTPWSQAYYSYNFYRQKVSENDRKTQIDYIFNEYDDITGINKLNCSNKNLLTSHEYTYLSNKSGLIGLFKFTDLVTEDKYSFSYINRLPSSLKNNEIIEYIPVYDSTDDLTNLSLKNNNVTSPIVNYVYSNLAIKNIVGKNYGNSGGYSFLYDSLNRIANITSNFSHCDNTTYHYSYDAFSRLRTVGNYTYSYNDNGDIVNVQQDSFNVHLNINNSVSIDKKYLYSQTSFYRCYHESKNHTLYLSNQTSAASFQLHEGIVSTLLLPHIKNSTTIESLTMYGKYEIQPINDSISFSESDALILPGNSFYMLSYSQFANIASPTYGIEIEYPDVPQRGDNFGFWFKMENYDADTLHPILSSLFFNGTTKLGSIIVYTKNDYISVKYAYKNDKEVTIFSGIRFSLNEWTFLSISILYKYPDGSSGGNGNFDNAIYKIRLKVNDLDKEVFVPDFFESPKNKLFKIPDNNKMIHRVSYYGSWQSDAFHQQGYCTAFYMSVDGKYYDSEDMNEIYVSSHYLINGLHNVFYSDPSSAFLSTSHFIGIDENCSNINGLVDTIPLINGFTTNFGAVPLKAEQSYALNYFADCSFLYNQVSHQFSYYASGKSLTYRFSFLEGVSGHTSGSISANITPLTHTNKQRYIFEIGTDFALLINSDGYLAYSIDDNDPIATSISIPANSLHRITVSWMYGIVVDSLPTTYTRFTIRVNNQIISFIYHASISWLDNPLINFGNKQNKMLYPLYGFIDSVVITKAELNTAQINAIDNNFKSVNILNKYSSNQFLNGRQFYIDGNETVEQKFSYAINPDIGNSPINQDVHREILVYQGEGYRDSIVTDYTYDISHRLVGISLFNGSASNNIQYTYDSLNRLTRSCQSNGDDLKYNYDSTHNIISVINNHSSTTIHSMTYSMNRMMSFDNYALTYDPNYIFNPYQYGVFDNDNVLTDGLTFAFMGKRLMNVIKTGTFDIPSMSFSYDFSGKRLSKTINGVIHQYYYDGDKLVYETETNVASSVLIHEKKFFYDENGILTFMELDGVRYFYYIDVTHTVRGLFNSDGELIVRYSYDVWGNVTDITDYSSNSLSTLNPFLFKCYYYDHESKWYYCLSRYYIPLWMRWLSIDDSSYLTSESPAGYNLYVYCNNNPVMYLDSTGTSPQWWNPFTWSNEAKIIAGIVIIAGLAIATVATGGAAGGVAGFILAGAFKGAAIGAVSGGLISGTIGGLTSGSWEGFVDGFSTGFMTGAFVGGVTGAASNAFKVGKAASLWDKGTFKSGFQSMRYHYVEHGSGFGNIVNYSNQAVNFGVRNAGSMVFTQSYTGLQYYWTWAGKIGANGYFTTAGKIITFWM